MHGRLAQHFWLQHLHMSMLLYSTTIQDTHLSLLVTLDTCYVDVQEQLLPSLDAQDQ